MFALAFAVVILAFAFRLLFRKKLPISHRGLTPTLSQKLHDEAFEHAHSSPNLTPILIVYATEYGFARDVARKVAAQLSHIVSPRIINVLHYLLIDFTSETIILFICSTTGDGVPPTEASDFRDALLSDQINISPRFRISLLALGDDSYPHFCRAATIFDQLFKNCPRVLKMAKVNQEDWSVINQWISDVQQALSPLVSNSLPSQDDYLPAAIEKYAKTHQASARHSRTNPYMATITSRTLLTNYVTNVPQPKEVVNVKFSIDPISMQYSVGDALALAPNNNSEHVDRLLLTMAVDGQELVNVPDVPEPLKLEHSLTKHLDISVIKPELVALLADLSSDTREKSLASKILDQQSADPSLTLYGKQYVRAREVFDVLSDFLTASIAPQQLVDHLAVLHARYYSISSTPSTSPDSIAITVDVLRYSTLNISRQGVGSTFLRDRCHINDTAVPIFVSKNPNFRLPKDKTRPIIMIGPGTGIAPFIAFVEERVAQGATGENWLFFGCRHESQDFLYKERLHSYEKNGNLKLTTAFSRDSPTKIYVQHRMKELSSQLWGLLGKKAHVYVCGDGRNMSKDVDYALKDIVATCGGFNVNETNDYVQLMTDERRYQRDVWIS